MSMVRRWFVIVYVVFSRVVEPTTNTTTNTTSTATATQGTSTLPEAVAVTKPAIVPPITAARSGGAIQAPSSAAATTIRTASAPTAPPSGAGSTDACSELVSSANAPTAGEPKIAHPHAQPALPARAAASVPSAREEASSAMPSARTTRPEP